MTISEQKSIKFDDTDDVISRRALGLINLFKILVKL